jgi:hypothetical protein
MASNVFPVAVASSSSGSAGSATTLTTAYTQYNMVRSLTAGIYTVTVSPPQAIVNIAYYDSSSVITRAVTSSGTVTVNLASDATGALLYSDTNSSVLLMTKTGYNIVSSSISGTLDTITSTSTYNQTGRLYVLAVGGGAGGGGANIVSGPAGWSSGRGGSGGAATTYVGVFNAPTSITIGAAGNGNAYQGSGTGNSGGTTSFGNVLSAAGGVGGGNTGGNGQYYDPYNSGFASSSAGSVVINPALSVKTGSNGGGGGGSEGGGGSSGAGSGIGTGGNGGPGAASGYGAGGGGGARGAGGGVGTAGVVYVLRGF